METQPTQRKEGSALPVYLAMGLLVVFSVIFLIMFANLSNQGDTPAPVETLTADTYTTEAEALVAAANPENGAALLQSKGCMSCHRDAEDNRLAPSFVGLGERAGTRHPPLSAAAYIYESILYPTAFEVEGYTSQMPQVYAQMLTEQELGDIIAYLLTE